tara:strand:- start:500 stop:628 length:129 start_codon:yes stop_codon:yes gene_type:complete
LLVEVVVEVGILLVLVVMEEVVLVVLFMVQHSQFQMAHTLLQ